MYITGGEFKGKRLNIPKSKDTRPTRQLVKKAMFDVLGDFVCGKEVLDLFSGSGALGFEALSRGANRVSFIENRRGALKVIKENTRLLGQGLKCRVISRDALLVLKGFKKQGLKFDLVFADPPYYQDLAKKCLFALDKYDILRNSVIIVIEHYKKDKLPPQVGRLKLYKLRQYGDTVVSFYTLKQIGD